MWAKKWVFLVATDSLSTLRNPPAGFGLNFSSLKLSKDRLGALSSRCAAFRISKNKGGEKK